MDSVTQPAVIWDMSPQELARVKGWSHGPRLPAGPARQALLAEAERIQEHLTAVGARLITRRDPDYPASLTDIPDPPAWLTVRGQHFSQPTGPCLAMVGTRKPTPYGKSVALRLARELSAAGVTVVSGLARGIDGAAHQGALAAGGVTWAVLGTGVDQIYPHEHRALAHAILERGALLSELLPGTGPEAHNFPERNRIISGLCQAVLVVEAGEKSGTLITVDSATSQGREVLAIPGSITSAQSVGPHRLIKQGATLVTDAADILQALKAAPVPELHAVMPAEVSESGRLLLGWLGNNPWHVDDLAAATGLAAAEVLAEMMALELSGLVRTLSGGYIVRI